MTIDNIKTLAGYPRQQGVRHVQTRLMFHYKTDCELCHVVNINSRRRRRRRRQAQFTDSDRVLTNDLVHDVLNQQA